MKGKYASREVLVYFRIRLNNLISNANDLKVTYRILTVRYEGNIHYQITINLALKYLSSKSTQSRIMPWMVYYPGTLSLELINFNHSMDKQVHQISNVGWNKIFILKLQQRNFIPHFTGHMITFPWWILN